MIINKNFVAKYREQIKANIGASSGHTSTRHVKYYRKRREYILERNKIYRLGRKDKTSSYSRARRLERKLWAIEYLGSVCIRCNREFHHAAFQFHHRSPEEKRYDPNRVLDMSFARCKAEIEKCDLLCANCHSILHWEHWN